MESPDFPGPADQLLHLINEILIAVFRRDSKMPQGCTESGVGGDVGLKVLGERGSLQTFGTKLLIVKLFNTLCAPCETAQDRATSEIFALFKRMTIGKQKKDAGL